MSRRSAAGGLLARASRSTGRATFRLIRWSALAALAGGAAGVRAQERGVGDLPLVEAVAPAPSRTFAVFVSGDGGWAAIDQSIAAALQKHGVSVVGVNSMKYFWHARTPDGAAADLARIIRHYRGSWDADSVIVVGYSRGATVLPFMVNRLPDDERSRVRLMALVGAERVAGFKFRVLDLLNIGATKGEPLVLPEIEKLSGVPVICFYGEKETDTVCPALREPHIAVKLAGGHHLDGNYGAIGDRIVEQLEARKP